MFGFRSNLKIDDRIEKETSIGFVLDSSQLNYCK